MDTIDFYYCKACDRIESPVLVKYRRDEMSARRCTKCGEPMRAPFDKGLAKARIRIDRRERGTARQQ